jgi:hypothetical protein
VGTCEFVVRLLARVTGERRGARYDWHKMLVGTVPEKKNMEKEERRKKKGSRSGLWKLKKIQYSGGYGSWTVVFQQNSVGAMMSREDTALKSVAPRMLCAVLAAAAW